MPIVESTDPVVNACCKDDANLNVIERRPITEGQTSAPAGALMIYQCQVCQRKHYVHEVAPIVVTVAGRSL